VLTVGALDGDAVIGKLDTDCLDGFDVTYIAREEYQEVGTHMKCIENSRGQIIQASSYS
jgi:hypothetical protein